MYLLRRTQLTVIKHLFPEFKFLNMTARKNLYFWNSSSCCSILPLTWIFCSFWNHSLQSPIHSLLLDWKKRSFTLTATTQAFPMSNHLCYSQMIKRSKKRWSLSLSLFLFSVSHWLQISTWSDISSTFCVLNSSYKQVNVYLEKYHQLSRL